MPISWCRPSSPRISPPRCPSSGCPAPYRQWCCRRKESIRRQRPEWQVGMWSWSYGPDDWGFSGRDQLWNPRPPATDDRPRPSTTGFKRPQEILAATEGAPIVSSNAPVTGCRSFTQSTSQSDQPMKSILPILMTTALGALPMKAAHPADQGTHLVFEGGDGPGQGRHIVMLAGDEDGFFRAVFEFARLRSYA